MFLYTSSKQLKIKIKNRIPLTIAKKTPLRYKSTKYGQNLYVKSYKILMKCYRVQAHMACWPINRPINREMRWGKEQGLYSESQQTKSVVDSCPKEPSYPSQNSGSFHAKKGGGVVPRCKLLGGEILLAAIHCRAGCNVPINLQQDKCYSLSCNF